VDSKFIKAEEDLARKGGLWARVFGTTTTTRHVSGRGILLLLLSKIAGCGHIVTTRWLLKKEFFEPAGLAVLRNIVTVLFLGAMLLLKPDLRQNLGNICREVLAFWRQVLVGAVGTFILQTFVMQSLDVIPATNLAVLAQLSPPFLFVISGFILKTERPSWIKFVGMLVAVAGAVVIIDPTHFKANDMRSTLGNLLGVGTALAYAIIVTVQKHLVFNVPAAALQFTFTVYAFPFFVVLAALLKSLSGMVLTPSSIVGAAFVGVCASLDYYFAFASLTYVSTLLVGLANSLLPLFVGIATYFVFGELLSWNDLVGAVLILMGMITVIATKEPDGGTQTQTQGARGKNPKDYDLLVELEDYNTGDVEERDGPPA